jgi:DNA-binding NarL/FixJ family response regulator
VNEEIGEVRSEIRAQLWEEYLALQRKADRSKLDGYTWALEEQLNHFVSSIAVYLPSDLEARSRSLKNLVLNRTKKQSRRRRLLEEWYRPPAEPSPEDIAIHRLQLQQTIAIVRAATSDAEWKILFSLACGRDYRTVARRAGMSTSALKSKVSRCRHRLSAIAA